MRNKFVALLTALVLTAIAVAPTLAGGPVYDELPDLEGREVVVAVENFYMPYQFVDPRADAPIGYEYDLINEICARINCTPVYETTTFELQLPGVADGTYDMAMNGLFITEERQENFDFSAQYSQAEAFLLVRSDEERFANAEELVSLAAGGENLIWGVQNASFGQFLASGDMFGMPDDKVVTFDEFGALLLALQNGDIDAMVVDAFGGQFISATGDAFKLVGEPLVDPAPMGLLFQKGSDLVAAFDAAIASMTADGYIDYLVHKWSTDFQPLAEE